MNKHYTPNMRLELSQRNISFINSDKILTCTLCGHIFSVRAPKQLTSKNTYCTDKCNRAHRKIKYDNERNIDTEDISREEALRRSNIVWYIKNSEKKTFEEKKIEKLKQFGVDEINSEEVFD